MQARNPCLKHSCVRIILGKFVTRPLGTKCGDEIFLQERVPGARSGSWSVELLRFASVSRTPHRQEQTQTLPNASAFVGGARIYLQSARKFFSIAITREMASSSNKSLVQDIAKLDKFDGASFRRWQNMMHKFLISRKLKYVIETPCPKWAYDSSFKQKLAITNWRYDDEFCRDLILCALSDRLQKRYFGKDMSAKELWDELNDRYFLTDISNAELPMADPKRPKVVEERENSKILGEENKAEFVVNWYLDSGAAIHVCKDRNLFTSYKESANMSFAVMGNNSKAAIEGTGTIELCLATGKTLVLHNVNFVPDSSLNLVSLSMLMKHGFEIIFKGKSFVLTKDEKLVGKGCLDGGLYSFSLNNKVFYSAYFLDSFY